MQRAREPRVASSDPRSGVAIDLTSPVLCSQDAAERQDSGQRLS
jgi:hypothetical protein